MGPLPRPFEFTTNLRFARDNGPKLLVLDDFCRLCLEGYQSPNVLTGIFLQVFRILCGTDQVNRVETVVTNVRPTCMVGTRGA